jgi:hypothetical protein
MFAVVFPRLSAINLGDSGHSDGHHWTEPHQEPKCLMYFEREAVHLGLGTSEKSNP